METQIVNATEYRNVSLAVLSESKTNPRRTFEPTALKELAESIRRAFDLAPPIDPRSFGTSTTPLVSRSRLLVIIPPDITAVASFVTSWSPLPAISLAVADAIQLRRLSAQLEKAKNDCDAHPTADA